MKPLDKLDLYRRSVQHPEAEVHFLMETYAHYRGTYPTLLREDFAGTAAVSAAWCDFADHHRAVAVESHRATLQWARRHAARPALSFVHADVLEVTRPRADVIAALNFSICEWHDRPALVRYLRHARRGLRDGGLLVADLFGGPGAMTTDLQIRSVHDKRGRFEYHWEQCDFDHVTGRIDCRIHFRVGRRWLSDAFRYDWRLWSPPELVEAMIDAGFDRAEIWCDRIASGQSHGDGDYRPRSSIPARHDFVAYVVGVR